MEETGVGWRVWRGQIWADLFWVVGVAGNVDLFSGLVTDYSGFSLPTAIREHAKYWRSGNLGVSSKELISNAL